jgi:hypothetical protein
MGVAPALVVSGTRGGGKLGRNGRAVAAVASGVCQGCAPVPDDDDEEVEEEAEEANVVLNGGRGNLGIGIGSEWSEEESGGREMATLESGAKAEARLGKRAGGTDVCRSGRSAGCAGDCAVCAAAAGCC